MKNLTCVFCGDPVPDKDCWRRVTGWERKARYGARRGGSDIALRQVSNDEVACNACISIRQAGLANQVALL